MISQPGDSAKTCLFSGRFDRPHCGHVLQILRLGHRFHKVVIPVLDYPAQKYPIVYRVDLLREVLSMCKGNYVVFPNTEHFATISRLSLNGFQFDIYASGNLDCLKHVASLGYPVLYVERAYDFSASGDYLVDKIRELLG